VIDYGDSIYIAGITLLKFDNFKNMLEPLSKSGEFVGFAPRYILPISIRNISNSSLNSSCIMIILDSEREIDVGIGKSFSQQVLGDSEIIVSGSALRHL
jgi:hypothetical protein